MLTSNMLCILNQNPYQNAGQSALAEGFSNNLPYSDIESNPITAEEFNTKMGSSWEMAQRMAVQLADDDDEPLFGTHLREATKTVKRVFGSR